MVILCVIIDFLIFIPIFSFSFSSSYWLFISNCFNYHYDNIIYNGWKIKSIASRPNIEPIALVSWIFIENQSPCISLLSWSRKLNVHRSSHCCNYLYWQDRCPQINASLKIWFTFNTQKRKHLDHKYWRNQQYRK